MMEENQKNETTVVSQKKKLKIDKKLLMGFAAGFVIAAILFSGIVFGLNPELLKGTTSDLGTKVLSEYINYWDSAFDVNALYQDVQNYDKTLKSFDRPYVSFLTQGRTTEFEKICIELNLRYGNYLFAGILTGVDENVKSKLRVGTPSAGVIYETDDVETSITFEEVENYISVSSMPWIFHDTTRYGRPVYYTMFQNLPASAGLGSDPYNNYGMYDWDTLGNIRVLSGTMIPNNYQKCDGSPYANADLADFYGAAALPNLTAPDGNTAYYMCSRGGAADANFSSEDIADGELSYHAQLAGLYDFYLGELVLISNMDKSNLPNDMMLCDGRSVYTSTHQALFCIIGEYYGVSSGYTHFNLPNLVGKSPLPGADFYISTQGLFPYRP